MTRQPTPEARYLLDWLRRYLNANNPNFAIPRVHGFTYGPRMESRGAGAWSRSRRIEFNSPNLRDQFETVARGGRATDSYAIVAPIHELGHLSGPPTDDSDEGRFWEEGLMQAMANQQALPLALRMLAGPYRGVPVYQENTNAVYQQAANIARALTRGERGTRRMSRNDYLDTPAGRRFVNDQVPLSGRQRRQYRANQARVARNEQGAPTPQHSRPAPEYTPAPRPKKKPRQPSNTVPRALLLRANRARTSRF